MTALINGRCAAIRCWSSPRLDRAQAHLRVAQVSQVGIIQLDVTTTCLVQGVDLFPVDLRQVFKELIQIRVGFDIDGFASIMKCTMWAKGWILWAWNQLT